MSIEVKSTTRVFGGILTRFSHASSTTKTPMTCSVFLPSTVADQKYPVLLYLSGLTCTDENVCQKSGVFKKLCEKQIAFVAPDTSPRGANIAGETESWDFGVGAGFYLDATEDLWKENYLMYSYITKELQEILASNFSALDLSRISVTGHSMGGHGALTIALKNPGIYRSVSAFAPICNPIKCPWGVKAFTGYLGGDTSSWSNYDASELVRQSGQNSFDDILIDVGLADSFLTNGQLLPEAFQAACDEKGQKVTIRYQDGFDHSYYFVSSFIDDHVEFHASRLGV